MGNSIFTGDIVQSDRVLHTPSDFAKTNLFYLQETGQLKALKPHKSQRNDLLSYLFFIVTDGEGILEYQDSCYNIAKGDCVFIDCHKPYSHYTSEKLWSLKWVHFYGPSMNGIYEKYLERGGQPYFTPADISVYEEIIDKILNIAQNESYLKDMLLFEQFSILLTRLMAESWHPELKTESNNKVNTLQSIKDYIDNNYAEKITLDMLSEKFYINKFYLTRIFKGQYGVSINTYLTHVRITHAKQLLRFSKSSIEQIGFDCGFPDNNYFSRIFKRVEGCTPGEFRRRW